MCALLDFGCQGHNLILSEVRMTERAQWESWSEGQYPMGDYDEEATKALRLGKKVKAVRVCVPLCERHGKTQRDGTHSSTLLPQRHAKVLVQHPLVQP